MHRSSTPRIFQTRSRAFWLASWFLVALYLVASGRAFIPGICATQRAMDAQCAQDSGAPSIHALRSCCSVPAPAAHQGEKGSKRPVTPAESGCALCKLVSSVAPLSITVALAMPPEAAHASPQAQVAQLASAAVRGAAHKRGPPAPTHS